jgi:hypothetical protein
MALALQLGCWSECPAPVSGPLTLGPEWTEITPPSPLISERSIQELHLTFPTGHDVDLASGKSDLETSRIQFVDGRHVGFDGFLYDDQGDAFPLEVSGLNEGLYLSKKLSVIPAQTPIFPKDRVYPLLRLRTTVPVDVSSITWECRSPH